MPDIEYRYQFGHGASQRIAPAAQASLARGGYALGRAVAELVTVLDIGHVVIGGGLSRGWSWLQKDCEAQIRLHLIPESRKKLKLSISRCDDLCGILGAALLPG